MLTVRHDIKLSGYPLLGGFGAARAASLRLAALTDDLCVRAIRCVAVVMFGAHYVAAARQHSFYASDLPEIESLSVFPENLFPSVVFFKKEFRCSRNKFFWCMASSIVIRQITK